MRRPAVRFLVLAGVACASARRPLAAQTASSGYGRVSLFFQWGSTSVADGGAGSSFNDAWATLTLRSATSDSGGLEFALDGRGRSTSAGDARENRLQLYDAWVGGRTKGGLFTARAGQMWLNELGALGAVGGVLLELRPETDWKAGRLRFGAFGGLEPRSWEAGWVPGVKKGGAYVALDGDAARRHVLGWVLTRNGGLTERSVVTLSNFVPVGTTFFLYQAAEYDLSGPGGQGSGGLTYLFANARWAVTRWLELQGTYHRGRSVDARTITQDEIDGRPVDPKRLEGLLFGSVGGRVSVEVVRGVRAWVGLARDTYNEDDPPSNRYSAGLHLSNLFRSGVDVSGIWNRNDRAAGSYDSWYASVGRSLGSRVYLSVDASNAVSVLRTTGEGGVVVETRPSSRRYTLNGNVNLGRGFSLLLSAERLADDATNQTRAMGGLSYSF
ncbi:hypothetical protein FBQ97_02915 [Acidobacteria bacterium ACD]|nr:hypothetical protein [Acidobacteria bacterium ACD]